MKVVRAIAGSIGCMVLLGCGDATITSSNAIAIPPKEAPALNVTSEQAWAISDVYLDQDPLQPFGVGYLEFFENPDLISDEQFLSHALASATEVELSQVESDAAFVEDYAESCAGGPDDGMEYLMSTGRCERMYGNCVARVRRIPERRARALGYAACMGAYAVCRAMEEEGEMR